MNTRGSYKCDCKMGYEKFLLAGGRQQCIDVDECAQGMCTGNNNRCCTRKPSDRVGVSCLSLWRQTQTRHARCLHNGVTHARKLVNGILHRASVVCWQHVVFSQGHEGASPTSQRDHVSINTRVVSLEKDRRCR